MNREATRSLFEAAIDVVDGVVATSALSRGALVRPYVLWDDEEHEVIERDRTGNDVRRCVYRPLGPPVRIERALVVRPDLPGLIRRLSDAHERAEPVRHASTLLCRTSARSIPSTSKRLNGASRASSASRSSLSTRKRSSSARWAKASASDVTPNPRHADEGLPKTRGQDPSR